MAVAIYSYSYSRYDNAFCSSPFVLVTECSSLSSFGWTYFLSKSQAGKHLIPPEGVVWEWTGVRIIVYAQTGLKYSASHNQMI